MLNTYPLLFSLFLIGCICNRSQSSEIDQVAKSYRIDKKMVAEDLRFFVKEPHPFGSRRQVEVKKYIVEKSRLSGAQVFIQSFSAQTPKRLSSVEGPRAITEQRDGANVYARLNLTAKSDCVVLIGSHYDTKYIPGIRYVGANDSGSSSVFLLDLIRKRKSLEKLNIKCDLVAVWFDGEEAILDGWTDGKIRHPAKIQDNTYGSRHAVSQLVPCGKAKCLPKKMGGSRVVALVLLDMIGSKNAKITRDSNSSTVLLTELERTLKVFGREQMLTKRRKPIEDDHIPFRRVGIPVINLIDFENVYLWHRPGDELSAIDLQSIEIIGSIGLHLGLKIASNPKGFPK